MLNGCDVREIEKKETLCLWETFTVIRKTSCKSSMYTESDICGSSKLDTSIDRMKWNEITADSHRFDGYTQDITQQSEYTIFFLFNHWLRVCFYLFTVVSHFFDELSQTMILSLTSPVAISSTDFDRCSRNAEVRKSKKKQKKTSIFEKGVYRRFVFVACVRKDKIRWMKTKKRKKKTCCN